MKMTGGARSLQPGGAGSDLPLVEQHPRTVGTAFEVGEAELLVKRSGTLVGFPGVQVERRRTRLAGRGDRRLHERAADPATTLRGNDVELLQIGLFAFGPERRPQPQDGKPE